MALHEISTKQASATESTNEAINQLLDYLATYPDDSIFYRAINMVLAAQYDARFHNESKARILYGAHILLVKYETVPQLNGPILTISKIIILSCHQPPKLNLSTSSPNPNK